MCTIPSASKHTPILHQSVDGRQWHGRVRIKEVQVHFQYVCGRNEVEHDLLPIRWSDFKKVGITRRVDQTSGVPFLLQRIQSTECYCY